MAVLQVLQGYRTAGCDHAIHHGIELCTRSAEFGDVGQRPVQKLLEHGKDNEKVVHAHHGIYFIDDRQRVRCDLGVEQGAGHDAQAQTHHLVPNVNDRAVAPRHDLLVGTAHDLVGIACDALPVKGRGCELSLTHMNRIVRGDQTLTEQHLHTLHGAFLDEAGCLVDKNLANPIGVIDNDDQHSKETVVADAAKNLVKVREERDGIPEVQPGSLHIAVQRQPQARRQAPFAPGG